MSSPQERLSLQEFAGCITNQWLNSGRPLNFCESALRAGLLQLLLFTLFGTLAGAQQPDTLRHTFDDPGTSPQTGDHQGYSVAMDGRIVVVGAPGSDVGNTNTGTVRVYDYLTGTLLHVLTKPNPRNSAEFGNSVAISGTRVVVGASGDSTALNYVGSAYVYDLASSTPTVPIATLPNPSPAADDNFGISVAISGTRVVIGSHRDDTGANDAGSAYVYDLSGATPSAPVATLNNPSPAASDNFGVSVAISGSRVVVGANQDDTGASNAGSAYVYELASSTPAVPVTTLNNPSAASGDSFGTAVAVLGTRVVIGANHDGGAGSAYVYDLAGSTPVVPILTITHPAPATGGRFGNSVAISDTRLIVGAPWDSVGAGAAGTTYVYETASATPTIPLVTLSNPTPELYDYFGHAVAISGTLVVVGAYYDDTKASNAGSAYVYDLASATPTAPAATLSNPSSASFESFGISVSLSGTRLVVGAYGDNTAATRTGSAYVYDLAGAVPTVPAVRLNNPTPDPNDFFGTSVAISGTKVVIGAYSDDTGATDAGSAYAYDLTSTTPTVPIATLDNPSPAQNDYFGLRVAISGTKVVVAASTDDTGGTDAGSAYVYDLASATPTVPVVTLYNPSPANGDNFGAAVAILGTKVVVGTSRDDTGANNAGCAYVYDLSSSTPTLPVVTLNNPSPVANGMFGASVAISGTRVVVGAYRNVIGTIDAGSAYVYDLASATPAVPVFTLNNPDPASADSFGTAVAISGTQLVVGAYLDDTDASNGGNAYLYDLASSAPEVPVAILHNPTPAEGDLHGYSVAIEGTAVAIGVPSKAGTSTARGAAYLFTPADSDYDNDGLLDLWEYARFGSATVASALDDTDGDGRNELLEQAFDSNPTTSDLWVAPLVTNESGFLTLTLTKRAGVSYLVETASSPDAAAFSAATTLTLIDNATTLKVRDTLTSANAAERLIRVRVNATP